MKQIDASMLEVLGFAVPSVPNFVRVRQFTEGVDVADLSNAALDLVADKWRDELKRNAIRRRDRGTNERSD